jgi:cobalt-zinc-cadmium efflux system membrane fusion protein
MPEAKQHTGRFFKVMQGAGLFVIVGTILVVFLAFVLDVPIPGLHAAPKEMKISTGPTLGVSLAKGVKHTLDVPSDVRVTLGIRSKGKDDTYEVAQPTKTRPLLMYGSTALDPTRLMRVRARFAPAEVVSVGTTLDRL